MDTPGPAKNHIWIWTSRFLPIAQKLHSIHCRFYQFTSKKQQNSRWRCFFVPSSGWIFSAYQRCKKPSRHPLAIVITGISLWTHNRLKKHVKAECRGSGAWLYLRHLTHPLLTNHPIFSLSFAIVNQLFLTTSSTFIDLTVLDDNYNVYCQVQKCIDLAGYCAVKRRPPTVLPQMTYRFRLQRLSINDRSTFSWLIDRMRCKLVSSGWSLTPTSGQLHIVNCELSVWQFKNQ